MAESLIKEGTIFHSILEQKLRRNEERTEEISKFASSISQLLLGFSGEVSNACRTFFRRLKIDESQQQNIIFLSKYIIDILNELSKKVQVISKKIELDVLDPLAQFTQNQKLNHHQVLVKSQQLLNKAQHNLQMLKQLKQNYRINQFENNQSREQKQVIKKIVESEIDKCNQGWKQIKKNYQCILGQINSFNSLRCHFTMKTQIEIVRLINRLVGCSAVDQSIEEYEDFSLENQTLTLEVKDLMRQKLGQLVIFEEVQSNSQVQVIQKQDQKQKKIIDDFVGLFINRSSLKDDNQNQQPRALILQDMRWTHYFLNKLRSSLHTQIQLSNSKFRQLASILKYIFALVVEADDNQGVLYSLLYISFRVRYQDQYLIKQLGKHHQFWINQQLWQNIIQYIRLTKLKTKLNNQKQINSKYARIGDYFNRASWLWNRRSSAFKRLKTQKVIQQARTFEILCEVNYYLAKLQIEEYAIFDLILALAAKHNTTKDNIKKLLEYHYLNKIFKTNKYKTTTMARKQRLEEQYSLKKSTQDLALMAVEGCLKFIPLSHHLINFLLVSRQWNTRLRRAIFRRYLIEQNNWSFAIKNRLKIYKVICHPPFTQHVYRRMVQQVPQETDHKQIINLDVRRSLGWDQKLRVKMVEVLKSYAFYHHEQGYLQGMNYLCENILKLTDDSYECYFIFEHLMNNQYFSMYTGNFDGLKLKIYQLMRLLQRQRPALFLHLQSEKMEGEHFLLSWAITLWGEMTGDLTWLLWDGFIVEGWRWWFKTILWLMKVLEPELLKMNFQEIMKCFSDLHSSLFSFSLDQLGDYGIDRNSTKVDIDRIRLEQDILEQIQKQYRMKENLISQYLKKSALRKK